MELKLQQNQVTSMTRRLLITAGCSFTVHEPIISCLSDGKIVAWPKIVAYELDMELINLAEPGADNSFIENRVTDAILKYKDDNPIFMVLWSQQNRVNVNDCFIDTVFKLKNYEHIKRRAVDVRDYAYTITKASFRSMWRTQNLAKQFGLDYIHHLGCWRLRESVIAVTDHPQYSALQTQLENDWYYKNLDFSMNEVKFGITDWYKPIPGDGHPDQWSHHKLAEMMINKYNQRFVKPEYIYD